MKNIALYEKSNLGTTAIANDFRFILFFGTLLGAVREHDFIKNDTDIDVVKMFVEYILGS